MGNLWRQMQVPFPELAGLYLSYSIHSSSVRPLLPDSFLGGSAPRLRNLYLHSIQFPGLTNLLMSATHLVRLWLIRMPHYGCGSPEAMADCLPALTNLELLDLEFEFSRSYHYHKSRRLSPASAPTRTVLPTLKDFHFEGMIEYFEVFVARINAPQIYRLITTFLDDNDFDTPLAELKQLMSHSSTFGTCDEACFVLYSRKVLLRLGRDYPEPSDRRMLEVGIWSRRQFSTLAQIRTLSLHLFSTIETLFIYGGGFSPTDIENTEWLDLLLPFTAVKNIYLSKLSSPRIAPALQDITGGRAIEVLPALQNVFLEDFPPSEPVQKCITRFIAARQLTNSPVAISAWHGNTPGHWR